MDAVETVTLWCYNIILKGVVKVCRTKEVKCQKSKRLIAIRPALPTAWELLLTVGILAAATIIGWVFLRLGFADANIIMVYLLGVLLTSAFTSGYICGVLSAFLSVILFNYFLTEPRLSLVAYGSKS